MEFQLRFRRKAGKDKPESSEIEFLEKFLVSKCVLSNAEDNTFGLLNIRRYIRFNFVNNTISNLL